MADETEHLTETETETETGAGAGRARGRFSGVREKAAPAIRRVRRAADESAMYVRETSPVEMKRDLETEIREHPIRSIGIALIGGYLLAKILD